MRIILSYVRFAMQNPELNTKWKRKKFRYRQACTQYLVQVTTKTFTAQMNRLGTSSAECHVSIVKRFLLALFPAVAHTVIVWCTKRLPSNETMQVNRFSTIKPALVLKGYVTAGTGSQTTCASFLLTCVVEDACFGGTSQLLQIRHFAYFLTKHSGELT